MTIYCTICDTAYQSFTSQTPCPKCELHKQAGQLLNSQDSKQSEIFRLQKRECCPTCGKKWNE